MNLEKNDRAHGPTFFVILLDQLFNRVPAGPVIFVETYNEGAHLAQVVMMRAAGQYYWDHVLPALIGAQNYAESRFVSATEMASNKVDCPIEAAHVIAGGASLCMYVPATFRRYEEAIKKMKVTLLPSPGFLMGSPERARGFIKKGKRARHAAFFSKFVGQLISDKSLPVEVIAYLQKYKVGKVSRDKESRRGPKQWVKETGGIRSLPVPLTFEEDDYTCAAHEWALAQDAVTFNEASSYCRYPYNRKEALAALRDFVGNRITLFGPYQDMYVVDENQICYHSNLSAVINLGLITPIEVVSAVVAYAARSSDENCAISTEGFLRQVIGWREYMWSHYLVNDLAQLDFWGTEGARGDIEWPRLDGTHPISVVWRDLMRTGYVHHIPRLMILNSYFLMSGYSPRAIFEWFMRAQIDSHEWVMYPCIWGFGYHDGGLIASRPYVSSSNYLLKMTTLSKDGAWVSEWDALYKSFVATHKEKLHKINPLYF